MFKLITYAVLGYFFYRYFIKPILPVPYEEKKEAIKKQSNTSKSRKQSSAEEEYIDYEEVD